MQTVQTVIFSISIPNISGQNKPLIPLLFCALRHSISSASLLCLSFIQGPPQEGQTVCFPTFSPGRSGARNIFYRLFLSYHSTRFAARRTDNMLSDLSPGHSGAEKMCAEKALYRKSLKHFLATLFVRPSSCFKEAKALTTLDFSGTAGCYRFFPITLFCPISPQKKIPAFLAENRYSKNASDSA